MSTNLVSVLMPVFNHEKFVIEAILSVINQTYENIELIIIDDGSSDNSWEKVQSLRLRCEKRFKNCVIKRQSNIGTAMTNSRLRSLAKGDFLYFLASDDVLQKEAIEIQMSFLSNNPDYIYVVGDNSFIDTNSKKCCVDEHKCLENESSFFSFNTYCEYALMARLLQEGKKIKGREDYRKLDYIEYDDMMYGHFLPIGGLIKAEVMEKITPYSVNTPLEDSYLMCQLLKIGKAKVLDKVTYFYRIHETNTARNTNRLNLMNQVTWFYEMYLLDTKFPVYKRCLEKCSPYMEEIKQIWNNAKSSPYWDESFYRNRYPEIIEAGYIPLVHYLSYGIREGGKKYIPSKYFDNFFRRPEKYENPLLPQPWYRKTFPYLFLRKMYRLSIKRIVRMILAYTNKNSDIGAFI